jgi:hypothetical protein
MVQEAKDTHGRSLSAVGAMSFPAGGGTPRPLWGAVGAGARKASVRDRRVTALETSEQTALETSEQEGVARASSLCVGRARAA